MAYPAPNADYPAVRKASPIGILLTSRETVPVVTAAAGTLLLTTALAQPLTPRLPLYELSISSAPRMSHAWQAIIIALLVAATAGALLWTWRHAPPRSSARRPESATIWPR